MKYIVIAYFVIFYLNQIKKNQKHIVKKDKKELKKIKKQELKVSQIKLWQERLIKKQQWIY